MQISDQGKLRGKKKGHYIVIKGTILQKGIASFMCMCIEAERQNTWDKRDRMQREIDESTTIVVDFNTTSWIINPSWQKIIKDRDKINNAIEQLDLIVIYEIVNATRTEYTSSQIHNAEHIIGYKTHLNKFERTEII